MAISGNAKRSTLTKAQWALVDELFDAALAVTGDPEAWLESACPDDSAVRAEVLSLLRSHEVAGRGFGEKKIAQALAAVAGSSDAQSPKRVGPYRIMRELGQGGMGTVYLAERDDHEYKTQVAIKLVRRGLDTDIILSRFYRERQTLARLQHPHIARLLDGGTTPEGAPFIVMEYVEGSRITDYCREHALNVRERLALFLNVCKAVDYAHRHLVVHRDLKPGNILVNQSGDVKLLDFGICKLLQSEAETPDADVTVEVGPRPLTPDYASPEQIKGDPITVCSDVYSLAAVLYDLLTGVKPHRIEQFTPEGIERAICENEIVRPSLAAQSKPLARELEGDLDNILLYALQKEPERRYASVEQFSEDIRRHLSHEPVAARPDTITYRAAKFLRRRRGFVMAAAAVVLSMAVGTAMALRSAQIARENLRMVRQLSNSMVFEVYDSIREISGATKARELIVKTGLQYLDTLHRNASGDHELQLELAGAYLRIGEAQGNVMSSNLGDTAGALASYRKALGLVEDILRSDPRNAQAGLHQVALMQRIGKIEVYTRSSAEAIPTLEKAAVLAEDLVRRNPGHHRIGQELGEVYNTLGSTLLRANRVAPAKEAFLKSRALLERLRPLAPGDEDGANRMLATLQGLANCETRLGRLKEAMEIHTQGLLHREEAARRHPGSAGHQRAVMFGLSHIGDLQGNPGLPNLGDPAGARATFRRVAEIAERLRKEDPADRRAKSDHGIALSRLALVLDERDKDRIAVSRQAIQLLRESVEANPANNSDRADLARAHILLGNSLHAAGDSAAALQAYRDGLRFNEPLLARDSGRAVMDAMQLTGYAADILAARGQRAESAALAARLLELADAKGPFAKGRPPAVQLALTGRAHGSAGMIFNAIGRKTEAREHLQTSRAAFRELERSGPLTGSQSKYLRQVEQLLGKAPR